MADLCCGDMVSKGDGCESSSRSARKRRIELRRVRDEAGVKRRCLEIFGDSDSSSEDDGSDEPKFGIASVCGRRREMEDAVAVHPSFSFSHDDAAEALHYFGVYDGHGCSHVAAKCKERLQDIVKEELPLEDSSEESGRRWNRVLERSFVRMDSEVRNENDVEPLNAKCRCELHKRERNLAGTTAVVSIVTPQKIVVANVGDSRAVLCRRGKPIPLSSDHKPDRPDELSRIQAAGGRVLHMDVARVWGILAMSRAIGDNFLKPYVSCEPEVTVTDRSDDDECLILATDGLWDVVSNETACGIAWMCLKGMPEENGYEAADACGDVSLLLTKLALARLSSDNVSVVVIDLRKAA